MRWSVLYCADGALTDVIKQTTHASNWPCFKILNAVYNGGFIFGRWCIFEVYDLHIAFNNIYFSYERHTPIGSISLGAFRRDPMTAFS